LWRNDLICLKYKIKVYLFILKPGVFCFLIGVVEKAMLYPQTSQGGLFNSLVFSKSPLRDLGVDTSDYLRLIRVKVLCRQKCFLHIIDLQKRIFLRFLSPVLILSAESQRNIYGFGFKNHVKAFSPFF
jgi:hypothetical protein